MDPNPNHMSCPTCGHTISNIAGACTYCGAMMAEKEQPPQADEKDPGPKAPLAASPPPLPQNQTHPSDINPDAEVEIPLEAQEFSASEVSQQPVAAQAAAAILAVATETQTESPDEWTAVEDEVESKSAVDEQALKSAPQIDPLEQGLENSPQTERIETSEPEPVADAEPASDEKPGNQEPEEDETTSAPDNVITIERQEIQTETAADDIQSPKEPQKVDKSGDQAAEPGASKKSEAEATPQASPSPSTSEASPPPEKTDEAAATGPEVEIPPKKEAASTDDAKAVSTSKSLGDTIILEVESEVEPVAAELPDTTEESAPSETRAESQEKNKPKADLTKAQALKKKKAALAKAHALKKQKLVLAKSAALKRKKAAQAKAQADIEAAKKKVSAAAAPTPRSDPGPETNGGMQTLLEKYKGRLIGINYDNSADIRKAQLIEANAEYFSVFVKDQNLKYSYPLKAILSLIEGKDGVEIGSSKQPKKFVAVIKIYPLVLF